MTEQRERSIEQEPSTSAIMQGLKTLSDKIVDVVQTIRPPEKSIFTLSSAAQAVHVKMRIYEIVISWSHTAAATITLTVGKKTYEFYGGANGNIAAALPFPIVVDRGVDVSIAASAGSVSAWLTYTPE